MAANNNLMELKAGKLLINNGGDIEYIYLVIKGKLTAYAAYGNYIMGPGSIAGAVDGYYGIGIYNYVASEDCTLERIPYTGVNDITVLCEKYRDKSGKLVSVSSRFVSQLINTYLSLIVRCRKNDSSFSPDSRVAKWELEKYNGFTTIPTETAERYFTSNSAVAAAEIAASARFATVINDACLQMAAYLGIDLDYVEPEPEPEPEPEVEDIVISDSYDGYADSTILAQLKGSLAKIISYSQMEEEDAQAYTALIKQFKNCSNKTSTDDATRRLRKEITDGFYTLYHKVFMKSLDEQSIPNYINMFLNFGYIDEELIKPADCVALYKASNEMDEIFSNEHICTVYKWLRLIYDEKKTPSRNSLDQNYEDYVREQARLGKLDPKEAMADREAKLDFEVKNMFTHANKMACGHISSFVPILTEDTLLKPADSMFTTAASIMKIVNDTKEVDYSLFYRSTVYTNEKLGITREFIYTEVIPDFILMPCVGTYGVMWQEIEGRNRLSPARCMLPILCSGKLDSIMLNLFGRFRWELCKRIQGQYWNVLAEKSLTSEYYDYLQFYKKNHELTEASKEKIKSALTACRNNYSLVFAKDYEQWVLYESSGSSRLNKVARLIFAKYCPFNKIIRQNLQANPAYTKDFEMFERQRHPQKKRIDTICRTFEAKGIEIPQEITDAREYLSR